MAKHIQTIRRQKPTNCLSVFDHFVGLTLKGLAYHLNLKSIPCKFVLRPLLFLSSMTWALSSGLKLTELILQIGCPSYHLI